MTDSCDKDVFNNGKCVAVIVDVASEIVESWCQLVSYLSGQKVDWFWMGGRAVVKAVGDLEKVDKAAYWEFGDGIDDNRNKLKHLGGAKSCYGYFPGGQNHWSNKEK